MKITQEKLPASQVGLNIEVPSDMSKRTYESVIQKFTRSLNIPGFRRGKVPRHVLLQRVGATQIKQAALEELIQAGFTQALKETEIEAIGNPDLQPSFDELTQQYQPGESFTFTAIVDVQPDVSLKQYQGFKVQAEEVPYDSTKVDTVLEEYRVRVATLVPVEDRVAKKGDTAIIDYHGRLTNVDTSDDPDAAEFPGNQAQDFQVDLEEGRFIAGFIDGIIGMSVGESKEITVPFPEEYSLEEVAGKDATFEISLKELKEKELPEVDDEFAQDISEFETLAELRASLENRYQQEAEQQTRNNKEQAIVQALLEQTEVELPETLIRQEVDYLITQTAMQVQNQGIDLKQLFTPELVARLREQSRDEAIQSLRRSLALAQVAKQESLAVAEDALNDRIAEIKKNAQGQDIDENRLREVVSEELLTDQVLSWLLEHSEVELVPAGTLTSDSEDTAEATPASPETESNAPADVTTVEVAAEEVKSETTKTTKAKATKKSTSAQDDKPQAEKKATAKEEKPAEEKKSTASKSRKKTTKKKDDDAES